MTVIAGDSCHIVAGVERKTKKKKRKKNPLRHKSSKANVLRLIWSVIFSSSWLSSTSTYVHEGPQLLTPEFKDLLSLRKSTIFHTATRGIKSSSPVSINSVSSSKQRKLQGMKLRTVLTYKAMKGFKITHLPPRIIFQWENMQRSLNSKSKWICLVFQ